MTVAFQLPPQPALPAASSPSAYDTYFASGAYDRRYPVPNRTVLALAAAHLPPGGHLIDYGCGSGRYLLALADRAGTAAGFDICDAALARLRARLDTTGLAGRVAVLGPDEASPRRHVARHGPADLVLCLFGVLSHIEGRDARRRTLERLAALLRPGSGRLILSAPNRRRRFRDLQRASGSDEIRYVRRFAEGSVELPYKLFDPASLRAELADAGLELERLGAESLLPETAIARSSALRAFDRAIIPLVPAQLGYGLLGVARRAAR